MATRSSLEELLRGVAPEKLDQPCRDDHLSEIALSLTDWQSMAPFLGLTEVDERAIMCRYPHDLEMQNFAMLRKWKDKFGRRAIYRKLLHVFFHRRKIMTAEIMCHILIQEEEETSSDDEYFDAVDDLPRVGSCQQQPYHKIITLCADYLRGRYQTQIPTFLTLQWPPPPTRHVFNLAMIQGPNIRYGPINEDMVRLMLQGNVNDILYHKTPVKLENIFQMDKAIRKVILIEGAPGSGKSTLAWYTCQQWGSGKLFQDFQAVVFVQLRDPAIQSARSVNDLLPAESRSQAARVVTKLQGCRGRGILWVMDGWDELPSCLHTNSVFHELIATPEMQNLHFSTVIITSRPIASGDLYGFITSRVEILGFTPTEVKDYFTEAVGGDSQTVQKLQDQLRERPVIEASCYLPLNAAIVTHLFLAQNHSLPTTFHGVFTSLVLCCLVRHATKEGKELGDISSLDNLPPYLQEPIKNICALAYHGVMENKVTFSTGELESLRLSKEFPTLGLLQGVESFTSFKKLVSFNFLHLSVQELLASFYISKLPHSEQVIVFKTLLGQPRFAAVFRFYAAFTKLEAAGIREVIGNIVKKKENHQLLLYLLHGLYEAQDLSLCQFVGSQLGELDFYHVTLSPVDCLSASYFISCICLTTSGEFKVDICNCSLDDYRVRLLVRELLKCHSKTAAHAMDAGVPGCIDIDLSNNRIHGNGTHCIAELISHSTVIKKLSLRGNKIQEGEDGLYHLSQALRTNTSLVELDLSSCGITAKSVEALADALSINMHLTLLDISGSELGDKGLASLCNSLTVTCCIKTLSIEDCSISEEGIKVLADSLLAPVKGSLEELVGAENAISDNGVGYIAKSLEVNKTLKLLDIAECGITEKGAKLLAECLKVNQSLVFLALHSNQISDVGTTAIANALPHNHSLKQLVLSKCGLTDLCMGPLVRALEMNTSLERLDLAWNQFTDAGVVVLGESLKKNKGLQIMELEYLKEVTNEGLKPFVLSLQENYCLTKLDVLETAGGSKVVQDEAEVVNQRRRQRGITELTVTGRC